MSDQDELIASIRKNSVDELRIRLCEYRGHTYVDLRTFTEMRDSKEVVATKKGVTVKPEQLDQLIDGLRKAKAAAEAT